MLRNITQTLMCREIYMPYKYNAAEPYRTMPFVSYIPLSDLHENAAKQTSGPTLYQSRMRLGTGKYYSKFFPP